MLRRLLVTATLTAGLLAAAGSGGLAAAQATPAAAPRPATAAWLYGVSATSRTNAWAVGAFDHADGFATLIERWNGKTWKHVPSGLNLPENGDSLTGIAAISARTAWAAGTTSSQYSFPLIDHWRGGRTWTQDQTPTPGGDGGAAYLNGVGAASAADAWAVGGYLPELAATQTMIEHWDGKKWATVPSPDPSRAGCVNDELSAVAASSAGTWAVGGYCGAALVLRLEGGQWRQVPSPTSRARSSEQLASVTVTSTGSAWAVGHVAGKILILRWNGAKWATATAPSPAGAKPALLTGVSAVSSSVAWAVGEADYPHHVRKLLIERWDGTRWKLVTVANPTP